MISFQLNQIMKNSILIRKKIKTIQESIQVLDILDLDKKLNKVQM